MKNLSDVKFSNEFVGHFKGDLSEDLTPRPTPGVLYSKVIPTPVKKPTLIGWSEELGNELGILKPTKQKDIDILAGNHVTSTMQPYAACYAGHQFGHWAGQLGDGRAITLAELKTADDKIWELQLKGAGPTPYSRRADGRAVLRSSLREYLMSEAMHYLGVPTTRALSLVSTGEPVLRDMFYNGNAAYEPGAIVMRASPSFLRFGSFEILAARKETENLKLLVDWTIKRYYSHLEGENKILEWFKEIVNRTAFLIVEWLRVGFVHGVMNTDNMSILGLTIDYGPFSFLDAYDPNFTPNTTDLPGRRYAFGKQASIGKWNLGCLAGAIAPLLEDTELLIEALEQYDQIYWNEYYSMMANKIGLEEIYQEDIELINNIDKMMAHIKPDMTMFYIKLVDAVGLNDVSINYTFFNDSFYEQPDIKGQQMLDIWLINFLDRIRKNKRENTQTQATMRQVNPSFILRNYLLYQAIENLEKGDETFFQELLFRLRLPYEPMSDSLVGLRPLWAEGRAGCGQLSCSS